MTCSKRKRREQTDFWDWKHWFPWVPWLFVFFFLVVTGVEILDLTNFLQQQTTRIALGEILQVSRSNVGTPGDQACFVTYQFALPEKQQVKGTVDAHICPYYYKAGDTVPIAYSRTDPTNVRILPPGGAFWGPVRENLYFLIGSIIFSILWMVVIRYVRRQ